MAIVTPCRRDCAGSTNGGPSPRERRPEKVMSASASTSSGCNWSDVRAPSPRPRPSPGWAGSTVMRCGRSPSAVPCRRRLPLAPASSPPPLGRRTRRPGAGHARPGAPASAPSAACIYDSGNFTRAAMTVTVSVNVSARGSPTLSGPSRPHSRRLATSRERYRL